MSEPPDTPEAVAAALPRELLTLMWALRQRTVRALEPLGLSPVRGVLLELLARGHQHPKDLARLLGVSFPAASTLLKEFEQEQLITRLTDTDDRRRVAISLSSKGQELHQAMLGAWHQATATLWVDTSGADKSTDELAVLLEFCRTLKPQL